MPSHFSSPGREVEENRGDSSIHSVQGKGRGGGGREGGGDGEGIISKLGKEG